MAETSTHVAKIVPPILLLFFFLVRCLKIIIKKSLSTKNFLNEAFYFRETFNRFLFIQFLRTSGHAAYGKLSGIFDSISSLVLVSSILTCVAHLSHLSG